MNVTSINVVKDMLRCAENETFSSTLVFNVILGFNQISSVAFLISIQYQYCLTLRDTDFLFLEKQT